MRVILLIIIGVVLISNDSFGQKSNRRQLVVSLYPFIPNAANFYLKVENDFEKKFPLIDLIINLNTNYYEEKDGILTENVDVYEIDCIFLRDFIIKKKIQHLPNTLIDTLSLMPASKIIFQDKRLYGIPHWICGNFLFYDTLDTPFETVTNLSDIERVLGSKPSLDKGLLIDLKGKLTLGEMYADALMDEYSDLNTVIKYSSVSNPDNTTISNLNRLPDLTYSDWGRDSDYHDKSFFYQRQFAKKNGRAFVGYSESLYSIIDQIRNSFYKGESCLSEANIGVKPWSISNKGANTLGWVDALSINQNLTGVKKADAIKFLIFFTSQECYYLALIPDWGDAPRYLLPAYKKYYTDKTILDAAPLYTKLFSVATEIIPVTFADANATYKAIGKVIDSTLKK